MKKKTYHRKTDSEKLEALRELLSPRERSRREAAQAVTFKVRDNSELRYVISCLLRVSIAALELEGTSCSPRMPYVSNELAVVTVLELVDNILPDDQLESYDAIEGLLLSDAKAQ